MRASAPQRNWRSKRICKLAAKKGATYLDLLKTNEAIVAKNVTENLYARHLRPLFVG